MYSVPAEWVENAASSGFSGAGKMYSVSVTVYCVTSVGYKACPTIVVDSTS